MIEFGEFAPDVAKYNLQVAQVARNVLPGVNAYLPLQTLTESGSALDAACTGAITLQDNDGNKYVYAGDATHLYGITAATVTDYSQVGDYTSNTERWNFDKWGDQVLASKFGEIPQIMTLGGTTFADLGGTPPQAKAMAVIGDFVVLGNTNDAVDGNQPQRVWWSGFDDETEWTPGTNQSNHNNLEGDNGNIQAIVGGEFGLVFMEKSIWRMDYEGAPTVWNFDEVEPGRGTPAPGSLVQVGSDVYFLSQDGFHVLKDGQGSVPIGASKVDRFFWNDLNELKLHNITSTVNLETGDIFWGYPSSSASDGVVDKLLIFNYKTARWSHADVALQILFTGISDNYTLEELDVFGTVDSIGISFDSATWQGGAYKLAAFGINNKLAFFSGAIMAATLETGDIFDDVYKTNVNGVRPIIDGPCTVTLLTKADKLDDTEVVHGPASLDASGKADFRTNDRYHRIRCATTGDFSQAAGVIPDQQPSDYR